jgi:protein SDA1
MRRREELLGYNLTFPIDNIYNPQTFADQLFSKLKSSKFKFTDKTQMMAVLSRLIGRHRLILPNFYSFLQKYLKYGNKDVGRIFAFLAEATHVNVPSEYLEPLIKYIILHFANESCPDLKITMGLNCITQMCARKPLLISEEDLKFLCELSKYKEKNVNRAIKCLINLYRDLNIEMLPKQFRGRRDTGEKESMLGKRGYLEGQAEVNTRVDGADLLNEDENGVQVECDRFLTNEDFRKIKKIKRKQVYKRELKKFSDMTTGERAVQREEFDLLANRGKLKAATAAMMSGEMEEGEIEGLDEVIEPENYEDWEEKIDDLIDYEEEEEEEEDDVDLTKPYDRNHGFLNSEDMMKFIPGKKERLEMAKAEMKKKHREKKFGDKIKQRGTKTNASKSKNKPYMMVVDKLKMRAVDMYSKIKKTKNQLGKVSKRLTNKLQNKKNKNTVRRRK